MDNITHSLVGLAAAKAGLEKLSPAATAACVIAANAPDCDILARLGGSWHYLHHHRGITHSILGTITLALLIPTLFYLGGLFYARLKHEKPCLKFRGLLICSLILCASHPLMDWTNSYGLRPFLPWSGKWYYGDLVFIVDPWIWLAVGGASFLLTKSGWRTFLWLALALILTAAILIFPLRQAGFAHPLLLRAVWLAALSLILLARRTRLQERFGRTLAVVALAFILLYWGALAFIHQRALGEAEQAALQLAREHQESLTRVIAMPMLADPMRWHCLSETNGANYIFDVSLNGEEQSRPAALRYEKPQGLARDVLGVAAQDPRATVLLDFARFPYARVEGDCMTGALVQIMDLRFTEPGRQTRGFGALEVPVYCQTEGERKR